MADKKVTNKSDRHLTLPGGVAIPKGESRNVANYEKIESNDVLKAWVDAGVIAVADAKAPAPKEEGSSSKQAPKKD